MPAMAHVPCFSVVAEQPVRIFLKALVVGSYRLLARSALWHPVLYRVFGSKKFSRGLHVALGALARSWPEAGVVVLGTGYIKLAAPSSEPLHSGKLILNQKGAPLKGNSSLRRAPFQVPC